MMADLKTRYTTAVVNGLLDESTQLVILVLDFILHRDEVIFEISQEAVEEADPSPVCTIVDDNHDITAEP